MRRRCLCPCHEGSIADRRRADGVDVRDVIEAAVACHACRNSHCAALLDDEAIIDSGEVVTFIENGRPAISVNGETYIYDDGEFRPWRGEDGG